MDAREIGFKVLCDIEKNNNYSNIAINKHFKNLEISDMDRGLATELIYGVVENKYYLDYIINKLSKIKVKKMSTYVKIFLRMGTYQILFLNSISDYAAVNETVKLSKKYDKKSSGFINAILRNEIRNKDTIMDITEEDSVKYLSIKYSYNSWIIKNWIENFGQEFTEDLLEANNEKPSIYIRTNTLKISREELIEKLNEKGIMCLKVPMVEEAIKVEKLKNIENNELFKAGLFTIQDISSMIVGKVINPKEDSLILDVCSAPGGKSTHLATLMNNTGQVIARDIFEHKLKLIKATVNRLGLKNVCVEGFDASEIDENSINKFDYVLADVPCSGLGIIRRKPEIKYKKEEELEDITSIQKKILENASKYVKIGGTLVYSTCTVQDMENINIITSFIEEYNNFELTPIDTVNVDLDNQDKGYLKIYPNIHGIDGFFIAKLKRIR
ncbi:MULTISPECIES: 16S rRNA (cytosine(967)-C(5))-methyltransferase RsmB [unclassified Clostridioides]|uniref:16S rRNA (cytosine(967)-C(5))-methyltransferase RsmB n=1 Tax=unclassified Clostridioides TaxID=2635829 RepID=UPI001D0CC99F|nr:16S rRNA (cytosine(967)-C(5))-methyltransferase RsmB [Clostridioides sp. ES-S-0001-02]MCC0653026.1 16S rRNA (cytosine(967)-C(5))-methyltransferase RsmB [Clostridioides sp. ES-S-0001-03]MCC0656990.1 16S rRNA (cytosine(967)-C(5))-methyltransferase RsmB [Clostridioides sp. ES-S-0123-01]MCC0680294.1 16S rRNA (cytosine(967)-C(5))-methyltransferase RsmB [Clostridioides sp. ES-S-0005-03]MCC0695439.1 16S rRNA (cytosine(967)-C(5))-methyltransferase RsmB [Clostridioides sp. ES-S-0048-02]MCC0707522.1 